MPYTVAEQMTHEERSCIEVGRIVAFRRNQGGDIDRGGNVCWWALVVRTRRASTFWRLLIALGSIYETESWRLALIVDILRRK